MNPITVKTITGLGLGSTSIIQTQNQEDWEMGGWKASRSISRGSVTHHTVEKVE